MKIDVCEVFRDLEGEGVCVGVAAIFIRLSECNLRCRWCDTKYAYKKGVSQDTGKIISDVNKIRIKYVSITGGEPLLQKKAVKVLISGFKNKFVNLETNGSLPVTGTGADMISMDFKLPSSGQTRKMLVSNLCKLRKQDQLKLVAGTQKDLLYAKRLLAKHPVKSTVIVMPVYKKIRPVMIRNFILKNKLNWRLGLQVHKIISV